MASVMEKIEQACAETLQELGDHPLEGSKLTLFVRKKYPELFQRVATPKGWLTQLISGSSFQLLAQVDIPGMPEPCYKVGNPMAAAIQLGQEFSIKDIPWIDADQTMTIYDQLHEVSKQLLWENLTAGQCLDAPVLDALMLDREPQITAMAKRQCGDKEWLNYVLKGSPHISQVIAIGKMDSEPSYTLFEFHLGVMVNKAVMVEVNKAVRSNQHSYVSNVVPMDFGSEERIITFNPGSVGIGFLENTVEAVVDGQAQKAGVQIGWLIVSIDGLAYSEELLDQKREGKTCYNVSFRVPHTPDHAELVKLANMKRPREEEVLAAQKDREALASASLHETSFERAALATGAAEFLAEMQRTLGFVAENSIAFKLKEKYPELVKEVQAYEGDYGWLKEIFALDSQIEKVDVDGLNEQCWRLRKPERWAPTELLALSGISMSAPSMSPPGMMPSFLGGMGASLSQIIPGQQDIPMAVPADAPNKKIILSRPDAGDGGWDGWGGGKGDWDGGKGDWGGGKGKGKNQKGKWNSSEPDVWAEQLEQLGITGGDGWGGGGSDWKGKGGGWNQQWW